jgi:protein translocase SecG subunit
MQTLVSVLPYIQIVLGVVLIALVLLQQSESSLGSAFGADSFGANYRSRRGAELIVFRTTIVVGILFVLSALAHIFI